MPSLDSLVMAMELSAVDRTPVPPEDEPEEGGDGNAAAQVSQTGEGEGTNYGVLMRLPDGETAASARAQISTLGAGYYAEQSLPDGSIKLTIHVGGTA